MKIDGIISNEFHKLVADLGLIDKLGISAGDAKKALIEGGFTPERQAFWKYEITRHNPELRGQYDNDGHGTMTYSMFYLLYRVLWCDKEYGNKFMLVSDEKWSDAFKSTKQVAEMMGYKTIPRGVGGIVTGLTRRHDISAAMIVIDVTSNSRWPKPLYNSKKITNVLKKDWRHSEIVFPNGDKYTPGTGLYQRKDFIGDEKHLDRWLKTQKPTLEYRGVKFYSHTTFDGWAKENGTQKTPFQMSVDAMRSRLNERELFLRVLKDRDIELDDILREYDNFILKTKKEKAELKQKIKSVNNDKVRQLERELDIANDTISSQQLALHTYQEELSSVKELLGMK